MGGSNKRGKKKVLVVDDEFTIRELVQLTLEPEYDVIKAEDGNSAIAAANEHLPSLVILDIMMPKMDGYAVCRKLRADEKTKHIPIIILTAKHQLDDIKEAIKADCDEYITKPFEPEFLKKRVDYYLKGGFTPGGEKKLYQYDKSLHYIKDNR